MNISGVTDRFAVSTPSPAPSEGNFISAWSDWAQQSWPKVLGRMEETVTSSTPVPQVPSLVPPTENSAEKAFYAQYTGWENTVPNWDTVLSKLRCDSTHSFGSCAQHCFTFLPDFNDVNARGDISNEIIPPSPAPRHFWSVSSARSPLPVSRHESLFGMTLTDKRDFKSCLLNVCVHDYVISDQIPGCLSADGTISKGTVPSGSNRKNPTEFDDLDFYQPHKAEMYRRFHIFTLSRFMQALVPECSLSSAEGCRLRPSNVFRVVWSFIMLGFPLAVIALMAPLMKKALSVNRRSSRCGPTVKDSALWPYLVKGLVHLNTACKSFEYKAANLLNQRWFGYTPVPPAEVELTTKLNT